MPQRPLSVILIVIGTMAGVVALYAITLAIICICHADNKEALGYFKDFGIYAAGALSGFLARTSTSDAPAKTEIVNTPANPVPTNQQ